MFVLHHDIPAERQQMLRDVVARKNNGSLQFIDTDGFLTGDIWENGTFNSSHFGSVFTADTVVRCFGARFFPQYDKIIYSDVDIIVTDDISGVFDIDIEKNYVAGVRSPFSLWDKNESEHLSEANRQLLKDKYIAGGIWVMNLKKIREDDLESRMMEIIKDKTIIKRFNDQDVMNIACAGNVGFIPLNYISYPYLLEFLMNPRFTSLYSRDELFDSIINPKIIHFAANKPWNSNPNYANLWWSIFFHLGLQFRKAPADTPKKHVTYSLKI